MFRRSFWDAHGFAFGEGVQYEDQYVTLPAFFLARSVEVLATTVYYWRLRAGSISHGRELSHAVRDRLTAIDWTSRWLADNGFAAEKPWYDASVFAQDLAYVPQVIVDADPDERVDLLDRLDDFLDRAAPEVFAGLPAIQRLAWHLVRRRAVEELREVLRFEVEGTHRVPPVRRLRHWYGDYPFRRNRALRVPRDVYQLDNEMRAVTRISRLSTDGRAVTVEGLAALTHLGAADPHAQQVEVWARLDERRVDFDVRGGMRPDLAALTDGVAPDLTGAGFVATLDLDRLRVDDEWQPGEWTVVVAVRSRGVRGETDRHEWARLCPARAATTRLGRGQVRAEMTAAGGLSVHVEKRTPTVTSAGVEGGDLCLTGRAPRRAAAAGSLRLSGTLDKRAKSPVELDGAGGFRARIPLAGLRSDLDLPTAPQTLRRQALDQWDLSLRLGKRSLRLALEATAPGWDVGDRGWAVGRNRSGQAAVIERLPRPVVTAVATEGTILVLSGGFSAGWAGHDLALDAGDRHVAVDAALGADGEFRLALDATAVDPPDGTWDLVVRRHGAPARAIPCAFAEDLSADLPLTVVGPARRLLVGVRGRDGPALAVLSR